LAAPFARVKIMFYSKPNLDREWRVFSSYGQDVGNSKLILPSEAVPFSKRMIVSPPPPTSKKADRQKAANSRRNS
jgi:hypothetical protein